MAGSSSAIGSRAWARRIEPRRQDVKLCPVQARVTVGAHLAVDQRPQGLHRQPRAVEAGDAVAVQHVCACASGLRQLSGLLGSTASLAASRVSVRQLRLSSARAACGQHRRSCAAASVPWACSMSRVRSSCSELEAAQRRSKVNDARERLGAPRRRPWQRGRGHALSTPVDVGVQSAAGGGRPSGVEVARRDAATVGRRARSHVDTARALEEAGMPGGGRRPATAATSGRASREGSLSAVAGIAKRGAGQVIIKRLRRP